MALDKKIKDALKDLEDKSVLEAVEKINDSAEAKGKVQKANEELTTQRKEWEDKEKGYKTKIADNDTALIEKDSKIKSLEESTLSSEELQKLKTIEKTQADFNAVLEEVKGLKEKIEVSDKRVLDAEEKSKKASQSEKEQALKTGISNVLAKHNITDVKNETAMHTIFAKGHATLETDEAGNTVEAYYTFNEKNEKVTSSLENMVSSFAESNKFLVSSSGNRGTGQGHGSEYVPPRQDNFESAQAAKAAEDADWERDFNTK